MGKAIITRKANSYTIDEGYAVRIIQNSDSTESYDLIPASDGGNIHAVGYRVVTTLNGDSTENVNLVPVGTGNAIETATFSGLLTGEYVNNIFKYTGETTEEYENGAYYQIVAGGAGNSYGTTIVDGDLGNSIYFNREVTDADFQSIELDPSSYYYFGNIDDNNILSIASQMDIGTGSSLSLIEYVINGGNGGSGFLYSSQYVPASVMGAEIQEGWNDTYVGSDGKLNIPEFANLSIHFNAISESASSSLTAIISSTPFSGGYTVERIHMLPTLDNGAVAEDILLGKTAYNDKGELITGTSSGSADNPILVSTTTEMTDLLTSENEGKFVKYIGAGGDTVNPTSIGDTVTQIYFDTSKSASEIYTDMLNMQYDPDMGASMLFMSNEFATGEYVTAIKMECDTDKYVYMIGNGGAEGESIIFAYSEDMTPEEADMGITEWGWQQSSPQPSLETYTIASINDKNVWSSWLSDQPQFGSASPYITNQDYKLVDISEPSVISVGNTLDKLYFNPAITPDFSVFDWDNPDTLDDSGDGIISKRIYLFPNDPISDSGKFGVTQLSNNGVINYCIGSLDTTYYYTGTFFEPAFIGWESSITPTTHYSVGETDILVSRVEAHQDSWGQYISKRAFVEYSSIAAMPVYPLSPIADEATGADIAAGKSAYTSEGVLIEGTAPESGLAIPVATASEANSFISEENIDKFITFTGTTDSSYRNNDTYRTFIAGVQVPADAFNQRPVVGAIANQIIFDCSMTPDLPNLIDYDTYGNFDINGTYTLNGNSIDARGYAIIKYNDNRAVIAERLNLTGNSNYLYQIRDVNLSSYTVSIGFGESTIYVQNVSVDFPEITETGYKNSSIINKYISDGIDDYYEYTVATVPQNDMSDVFDISFVESVFGLINTINISTTPRDNILKMGTKTNKIYVDRYNENIAEIVTQQSELLEASLNDDLITPFILGVVISDSGEEAIYIMCDELLDTSDTSVVKGHALNLVTYGADGLVAKYLWSDYTGSDVASLFINHMVDSDDHIEYVSGWNNTAVGADGELLFSDSIREALSAGRNIIFNNTNEYISSPEILSLFSYYSKGIKTNLRYNALPYTDLAISDVSDVKVGKVGFDSFGNEFSGTLVPGEPLAIADGTLDAASEYLAPSSYNAILKSTADNSIYRLGRPFEVDDVIPSLFYILPPYGAPTKTAVDAADALMSRFRDSINDWDYNYSASYGGLYGSSNVKYLFRSPNSSMVCYKQYASYNTNSNGMSASTSTYGWALAGAEGTVDKETNYQFLVMSTKEQANARVSTMPNCTFMVITSDNYATAYYHNGEFSTSDNTKIDLIGTSLTYGNNFAISFTNASSDSIRLEVTANYTENLEKNGLTLNYSVNSTLTKRYTIEPSGDAWVVTTTIFASDGSVISSNSDTVSAVNVDDILTSLVVDDEITLTITKYSASAIAIASSIIDNTGSRVMSLRDAPYHSMYGDIDFSDTFSGLSTDELMRDWVEGDRITYVNDNLSVMLSEIFSFTNYDAENSYKSSYTLRQLIELNRLGVQTNPVEVSTDAEMAALDVQENSGKVYKFTGTTGTYTNGAYYIIS